MITFGGLRHAGVVVGAPRRKERRREGERGPVRNNEPPRYFSLPKRKNMATGDPSKTNC